MLYTPDALFVHVPKTAGMSVTRFLVNVLDGPVTLFVQDKARDHARGLAASPQALARLSLRTGIRHETVPEAAAALEAAGLARPPLAFAVIREPAAMLLSYYNHMRRPKVWKRLGMTRDALRGPSRQAMELPFAAFVDRVGFYQKTDAAAADYFRPGLFERLDVVAMEHLPDYLTHRFAHHAGFDIARLEHRNKARRDLAVTELDAADRAAVQAAFPRLERIYRAAQGRDWAGP